MFIACVIFNTHFNFVAPHCCSIFPYCMCAEKKIHKKSGPSLCGKGGPEIHGRSRQVMVILSGLALPGDGRFRAISAYTG